MLKKISSLVIVLNVLAAASAKDVNDFTGEYAENEASPSMIPIATNSEKEDAKYGYQHNVGNHPNMDEPMDPRRRRSIRAMIPSYSPLNSISSPSYVSDDIIDIFGRESTFQVNPPAYPSFPPRLVSYTSTPSFFSYQFGEHPLVRPLPTSFVQLTDVEPVIASRWTPFHPIMKLPTYNQYIMKISSGPIPGYGWEGYGSIYGTRSAYSYQPNYLDYIGVGEMETGYGIGSAVPSYDYADYIMRYSSYGINSALPSYGIGSTNAEVYPSYNDNVDSSYGLNARIPSLIGPEPFSTMKSIRPLVINTDHIIHHKPIVTETVGVIHPEPFSGRPLVSAFPSDPDAVRTKSDVMQQDEIYHHDAKVADETPQEKSNEENTDEDKRVRVEKLYDLLNDLMSIGESLNEIGTKLNHSENEVSLIDRSLNEIETKLSHSENELSLLSKLPHTASPTTARPKFQTGFDVLSSVAHLTEEPGRESTLLPDQELTEEPRPSREPTGEPGRESTLIPDRELTEEPSTEDPGRESTEDPGRTSTLPDRVSTKEPSRKWTLPDIQLTYEDIEDVSRDSGDDIDDPDERR